MDNYDELKWKVNSQETVLHTPVFDVISQDEESYTGINGKYVAMSAPDWVLVIPEYEGNFLLVRQWRHGSQRLTLEFPGGVADKGEDPAKTAARELREETGFVAGELIKLGSCNPNPAIFKNTVHFFLARNLTPTGEQQLDSDELIKYETMPIDRVIGEYGSEEFSHALMGTALAMYMRSYLKKS